MEHGLCKEEDFTKYYELCIIVNCSPKQHEDTHVRSIVSGHKSI